MSTSFVRTSVLCKFPKFDRLNREGGLGGGALGVGAVTLAATAFGIGTGGVGFILVGVIAAGAGVAGGYYGSKGGAELADLIYQ